MLKHLRFVALLATLALPALSYAATPVCAVGADGVAPTASISFKAPTLNTDATTIPATLALTYNVYQGTSSGAEVKVASGLVGSPITVSTGLTSSATFYWYITVSNGAKDSAPSNEACKTFPAATPSTVTITVT